MWFIKSSLILAVIAFSTPEADSAKGCLLPRGGVGVCKRLMDCPEAFIAWTENKEYPNICDSEKGKESICCELPKQKQKQKPKVQPTTRRPANGVPSKPSKPNNPNNQNNPRPASVQRKSSEKCKEYAREVRQFSKPRKGCNAPILSKKAFESRKAPKTDYPYTAQVGYNVVMLPEFGQTWDCVGTLISHNFVLTSAHCLRNVRSDPISHIRWLRNDTDVYHQQEIAEVILHPQYEPVGQYNDIALLRLKHKIKNFDDYIRPACLNTDDEKPTHALATGWGRTRRADSYIDLEDLLVAGLPILSHKECVKQNKKGRPDLSRGVDERTQFCAGGNSYAKTLCLADHGGPLVVPAKECMFKIVGIASSGSRCKFPGIYTRVSPFITWIESIVWPND